MFVCNHLAYLTAIYMLATRNHSGQWSKGYRLIYLAEQRASQEHNHINLWRIVDLLENRKDSKVLANEFINAVAYYLRRLRKYRKSM